jgi:hypothetical protein
MGKGPIVLGKEWPVEHICEYAEGIADTALAGSIEQIGEKVTLRLSVWNCRDRTLVKTFEHATTPQLCGRCVLEIEKELLGHFGASSEQALSAKGRFYARPPAEMIDRYLVCLGGAVSQVLAGNGGVPLDAMWGERGMLEGCLAIALEMNAAQVPRILFLTALAMSRAFGSSVYGEFRRQALALLASETSTQSAFYRLSPLLFKVFEMHSEFAQRKMELLRGADPPYREWIERL